MRKSLNEMKGKGETTPKPGIQKNNSNEGTQTEKKLKIQKLSNYSTFYTDIKAIK